MLEIFGDQEKNSDRAPSPPWTFAYADMMQCFPEKGE
jgi:hypothetical protein